MGASPNEIRGLAPGHYVSRELKHGAENRKAFESSGVMRSNCLRSGKR